MIMNRIISTSLLLLLSVIASNSQILRGTLLDRNTKEPVEDAILTATNKHTKAYIRSELSAADGNFILPLISGVETSVVINAFGYNDTTLIVSTSGADVILEPLLLSPSDKAFMLSEITVSAKPYSVRRATDRLVMSINGMSEFTKNNTIFGLLRYVPLLRVNELQGISMAGREKVEVYINGRKAKMPSDQVTTYLNSLPAESIKNIELITNPGSQFDVPANTGIINITLRRAETDGLRGFATAQMWQTHYNKQIGSLNLNYTRGKFGLVTTLGARNIGDWAESLSVVEFLNSGNSVERKSTSRNRRQIYSAHFDMNYALDNRQSIGVVANFNLWKGKPKQVSESKYYSPSSQDADSMINTTALSDSYNGWASVNLNYSISFNDRSSLALDADYQYYKASSKLAYEASGSTANHSSYNQQTPTRNDLWTAKGEYVFKPSATQKLIVGAQAYTSKSVDETRFENVVPPATDFYESSKFDYSEKGISGYINFEHAFSERVSSSIGMRYEHTYIDGELRGQPESYFSKNINRWLPSLNLTYVPSQSCYLWYTLGMQSSLVPYVYLNPFVVRQTATSYTTGNPNLIPPKSFFQGIGCYIAGKYLINLSHSVTKDGYEQFTLPTGDNEEVTTPLNYGNSHGFSASVNASQAFFNNIWTLSATVFGDYTHYFSPIKEIDVDKGVFYADFSLDNTFVLSKRHSCKLLTNYQFRPSRKGITSRSKADMRASIELRKDWGDWSLSMSAYRSWNSDGHGFHASRINITETPDMRLWSSSRGDFQGLMLKATYNWGNRKVRSKKHNSSGADQNMRYSAN